ncbi:unnamed protein product, partial [Meganyctiphanes norvegica]
LLCHWCQCYRPTFEIMEEHKVVPEVVDNVPPHLLQVEFRGKKLSPGDVMTPTSVADPPTHLSWPTHPDKLYTLVMTDPDAKRATEPVFKNFGHWLVVNIPNCDVAKGQAIAAYLGSGPPKGQPLHRYVYLVYEQPNKLNCDEPFMPNTSPVNRRGFDVRQFAEKYKLKLLAGNFYQAEYDEYCDVLHRQLGLIR